jgi:hypothetical protein
MDKLHITQDDFGYWMLSLEKEDGTLTLMAHQFVTPDHLIENANELVSEGKVHAVILIDPPRPHAGPHVEALAAGAAEDYKKPAPRKAGA